MSRVASPRWHSWAGLMLGPMAWGLDQQVSSMWAYNTCHTGVGTALAIGLGGMLITLTGGALSWRRWRASRGEDVDHAQRFFSLLSVVSAAYFAMIIIAGTAAALILRECMR